MAMLQFLELLVSLALGLVLVGVFKFLALKLNIVDVPGGTLKKHHQITPYLGGLAIFCTFWCSLWLLKHEQFDGYFMGLVTITLVGLLDDLFVLTPGQKIIGQAVATVILVQSGAVFSLGLPFNLDVLISFGWIITLINSYNLVDVMDGLATTIALGPIVALYLVAVFLQQYSLMGISMVLLGSLLSFLVYNFPVASIYLGDTGSMLIGAIIAVLLQQIDWLILPGCYWYMGMLVPIILAAIPLLELGSLIVIRKLKKIPVYYGSRDHFCHYLQLRGWSIKRILAFVIFCNFLLATIAILITAGAVSCMTIAVLGVLFLVFWLHAIFQKT